jgi:anti-sigma B factor antagonist
MEHVTGELCCESRAVDGDTMLMVVGAVDVGTVEILEEALTDALGDHPRTLTVDLRRVNHLDSLGVHVIVRALRRSRTSGVDLQLCIGRHSRIGKVLALSGLKGALPVLEDC